MIADHGISRDQRLPPAFQRINQRQPAAPGPVEPGTNLTRTMPMPDVRVQDGGETVLIRGEFGTQAWQQRWQNVIAAVAEERLRVPGGVEHDELLPTPHTQCPAEPLPVRTSRQHPVKAGIPGEHGRRGSLRTRGTQAIQLLGMGENQGVREGKTGFLRQKPLRG
ncbi:hypothetical protein [Streptomyces lunaelactis]|uniref:hypothetical protein n=1 Tax=Streptomyces lunaelactis TaxID=1535768 RepID=UPI002815E9E1|nr:hypothetical protein [Streptomyces lunaelactis]